MSDKEISGASDKVVILGLHRSSLTSGRADAANIPAPSILAELEKNNRILAAERDALLADAERYRYLRNRKKDEVFSKSGPDAGCWIDCEDEQQDLVLLTGDDADAAIDAARSKP